MADNSKTALAAASAAVAGEGKNKQKRLKPISFQKMSALQEEISKIDMYLSFLKSTGAAEASDGAHEELMDDMQADFNDTAVSHMLTAELCQLCAAGSAAGVRMLLHGGADPNTRDYDDRTLLHIACVNGRTSVVMVLLDYGADCSFTDRDGKTPQDVAAVNGHPEIVQLLSGYRVRHDDILPGSFAGDATSVDGVSPNSAHQHDFSSVPQPMVGSLIVVMVGLPGRGKTYVAQQIRRYFQWNGLPCDIFSHQVARRRVEREIEAEAEAGTTSVDGGCLASADLEVRISAALAQELTRFVWKTGGVAVLDGTQSTRARRQSLLHAIKKTQCIRVNRVVFVEVVNNDAESVRQNILRAKEMFPNPPDDFVDQYYKVIKQHESVYATLNPTTDQSLSYIRLEDNTTYSLNMISGWMPSRLAYMLHNLSHAPMNVYLSRPGEYVDMVEGRIGGNSRLTERGKAYSLALYRFFQGEISSGTNVTVMSSCAKRSTQTVHYFGEAASRQLTAAMHHNTAAISHDELRCRVSYFPTLDDINHGDCEGQLLADVRKTMPSTLQAMKADPYYTAWPNGECIHQVFNARLEPHIHDIQASNCPVLVVSHLHLLQGLYSFFVTEESKIVAPQNAYQIAVPFESVIRIKMVGVDRVAEIVDLSGEVNAIMSELTGQVVGGSQNKDTDQELLALFRRPTYSDYGTPDHPVTEMDT